ncbi:scamp-domain-containing protein [Rhizoclosmatium globosum]|uniref:Scamp-domain-containing protein n=1 Tax=Rhizoclosmatium globosum TaxID=329046 RepID=A0A1Y2BY69_9FUNG|nr:scamp-domain-containing protein [Rhizoclosmatium globosum]|eukprot:ORY39614.1 scamp-domain-containing protein [Rhizoclosmatium globosum]
MPREEDEIALVAAANEEASSSSAAPPPVSAAALAKEEALRKKEAELLARERQLAAAEQQQRAKPQQQQYVDRTPNFPWIWPVMFHNIALDIPAKNQWNMLWMYRSWLFMGVCLFVNCVAALTVMLSHPTGVTTAARDFGVSVTYWIGVLVASFYLWYRPVYNAYLRESSMYFNFYFFFGAWHIVFDFYMFLGIPGSGSAGIIYAMSLLTDDASKIAGGVLCSISSFLWLVTGLWSFYMYRVTHRHYRSQGLTSEAAQQEALTGVAKTGVLQTLVKSAAMG